jgi:hypothetical protein
MFRAVNPVWENWQKHFNSFRSEFLPSGPNIPSGVLAIMYALRYILMPAEPINDLTWNTYFVSCVYLVQCSNA